MKAYKYRVVADKCPLKRIMGFGTDYTLVGTQTEQKKFIGNAVECHMSQALCEALANELNR